MKTISAKFLNMYLRDWVKAWEISSYTKEHISFEIY